MSNVEKSNVKSGSFLNWIRKDEIRQHMHDENVSSSFNHSHYISLAQNTFNTISCGAKGRVRTGSIVTRFSQSLSITSREGSWTVSTPSDNQSATSTPLNRSARTLS